MSVGNRNAVFHKTADDLRHGEILCGGVVAEAGGLAYKLLASIALGVFITAGTLPLVK